MRQRDHRDRFGSSAWLLSAIRGAQASRRSGAGRSSLYAAAAMSLSIATAVVAQAPRVIDAQPGVPLPSRLTPDDRVVTVRGGLARPGIDVRNI
jgi:hypothetical protein